MPRRLSPSLLPIATAAAVVAATLGAISSFAQVPPLPPVPAASTQPSTGAISTADLETKAVRAFEANDYATALPLLKDLSVRLRNTPEQVGPVLEKVRVCETNLAQQQQLVEGVNTPRVPHVKPAAGETYEVQLKKLGNFAYDADKGGGIPDDVTALTGTTVKLHGYMIPIDEAEKVTKFVLVPDLFACCFGQPPQLQHTAVVVCPPGKAVTYFPEEINVIGELKVGEVRDEGYVTHLFEVKASSIRPLAK